MGMQLGGTMRAFIFSIFFVLCSAVNVQNHQLIRSEADRHTEAGSSKAGHDGVDDKKVDNAAVNHVEETSGNQAIASAKKLAAAKHEDGHTGKVRVEDEDEDEDLERDGDDGGDDTGTDTDASGEDGEDTTTGEDTQLLGEEEEDENENAQSLSTLAGEADKPKKKKTGGKKDKDTKKDKKDGNDDKKGCKCDNGTPNKKECKDGEENCESCKKGYEIVKNKCKEKCQCTNGEPQKRQKCEKNTELCKTCNSGYTKNKKNKPAVTCDKNKESTGGKGKAKGKKMRKEEDPEEQDFDDDENADEQPLSMLAGEEEQDHEEELVHDEPEDEDDDDNEDPQSMIAGEAAARRRRRSLRDCKCNNGKQLRHRYCSLTIKRCLSCDTGFKMIKPDPSRRRATTICVAKQKVVTNGTAISKADQAKAAQTTDFFSKKPITLKKKPAGANKWDMKQNQKYADIVNNTLVWKTSSSAWWAFYTNETDASGVNMKNACFQAPPKEVKECEMHHSPNGANEEIVKHGHSKSQTMWDFTCHNTDCNITGALGV